jgi:hypothetical protein
MNSLAHVSMQLKILTNSVSSIRSNFVLLDKLKKVLEAPRLSSPNGIDLIYDDDLPERVNCDRKKFKMAINILIQFASVYSDNQKLFLKTKHDRMLGPTSCLAKI